MLPKSQVEFYEEHGYLHLKGVLSAAELAALQDATAELIAFARAYDKVPQEDYLYKKDPQTGKMVLWRINYLTKRGDIFRAQYGHPKMLEAIASLTGYDSIIADESVVIKSPAYGAPVSWHRDLPPGMTRASDGLTVIGLDLDKATVANGCVYVVPGSHHWPDVDIQEMVMEHGFNLPGAIPLESEPGDMVIHKANLLHGSRSSRSGQLRRTIYYGVHPIDQYVRVYKATPTQVKIQAQYIYRGIEVRRQMPFARGETPFEWKGSPQWTLDATASRHVEWAMPTAHGY